MNEYGPTDTLCRYLAGLTFEDLPQASVTAARHVLLDAMGVMLGASGAVEEVRPFIMLARSMGEGPSQILGTPYRVPAPAAALANGSMMHALDFEDTYDAVPGHPNASLVPALIALAEARRPVHGRRFLTALVAGCDLACRMGLALDRRMEEGGWYPPPILAGFGAAAGAAMLLGLGPVRIRDCLSLALCQVTMPGEIKYSTGTVIRAVREAFPAQAAVQSALLAEEGLAGFETPLEGRSGFYALYANGLFNRERLLDRLGRSFQIEQLTFKPWPSCRGTHPFIEAALELGARGIGAEQIDSLHFVIGGPDQQMLVEPVERKQAPQVVIDAKFSIPFCTALALVRGRVRLEDFSSESLTEERILSLTRNSTFELAPRPHWKASVSGALLARLRDGSEMEIDVPEALGSSSRPIGEEALREKFFDCVRYGAAHVSPGAAARLADGILSLEHVEDVGSLLG